MPVLPEPTCSSRRRASSATRRPDTPTQVFFAQSTVTRLTGCGTESGGHYSYWAYWHGGARWLYANDGPGEWTVSRGDVEGWRFEPDGSASPADPPPRAPSTAAALESTTSQKQAVVQASSGDRAGPVHVADSDSATKTALFGICLGLILLIGAAALFRVRRAHGRIS